ncbi:mucin-2-like [Cydia pomonella]|uniref:mucin-2-like n=1 Tax=Cydia pomonella TaxID=82600 RepID=UPI002ADDFA93|nr:mucin-2-like [Cydia pomonella]
MLQPRLFGCAFDMRSFGGFVCFAIILSSALVSCQDINKEESIEATRIKREGVSENRDLTVLLVNDQQRNDYNSRVGRYHSVKPLIGLLTSTARTFIQDGVTTEFATQILGTTLNNGRIYAQLLTKSSLVLYNKPANDDAVAVKPTRVHSAFDGQWSVKQDLGFIDPDKFVLKNTDYLAPSSRMDIVYASKPAQESNFWNASPTVQEQDNQIAEEPTARRVQQNNEIPRFSQNEAFNYLDGPSVDTEKKFDFVVKPAILENVNALYRQSKAYEPVTEPIKIDSRIKEELNESNIVKVKPNYDLPTFTIKNEFSPIFYYIDNVESRSPPQPAGQQTKLPKKLFGQKSESRPKKTFTYAGFADFTTVVGDTVIIFTPNTDIARPQSPDEVNVFPSAKQVDKLNTKITFLVADIPVATATYKPHEVDAASKVTTPSSDNVSEKVLYNDEDSLKKVHYDIDNKPTGVSLQSNSGFDFNLDVIQPSEASVPITESTRLTDNLEVIPIQDSSKATDPLTLLRPSATIIEDPKESAITENNLNEDLVTSEEEADNTAAEVTEKSEEENDEEDEEEEEITTPANESGIITTTESGHSEESYEDIETTTETKHDTEQEVICSSGIETKSIMTTAYKTLTYLTTYFIPLESKVTTTSVKSNVVVESNVGYLTNVVCKSDINIEPTAVVKVNVQSSVHSSLETPEVETEGSVSTPPTPTQPEVVTEPVPMTTPKQKESSTTAEDKDSENGTTVYNSSQEDEKHTEENETTIGTQTTTTERVSTSQSHVEVSVSTEHATTPTEKPTSEEEEEEEEDSKENEIDLIYKTLYTTYTYFTTFFGDQTSSVASHKSIVTNVITSTINLAKLDPSLLGAFDEDEIAPTSVGIGRPTESFAINSIIDLVKNKDVLESVEGGESYSSQTPTPSLGDDVASIKPDAVKTYFTTYTFFTTIYVGTDANVCSRSEVYTNYVGPDELIPTKSNLLGAEKTKAQFDFRNCKQVKREPPSNPEENSSMESSVSMEENDEKSNNENKDTLPLPTPVEVDMLFSVESNPLDTDNSYTDTVTDVKSSSSRGERQYIENNNVLDDQISSESNIDEIMPSPTLLLQTSYTTFTYFTTMYIGKDSSKVKSRLETITNVVTETITPKKEAEEESNLPITYYTTFTYWTTLYKDKTTTITSREEIVSNIVTPVVQVTPTISPIDTTPIDIESVLPPKELEVEIKPSLIENSPEQDDGKATFYTTYTYFTTFYAGNTSQIRSSLETVTNIVDNTKVIENNQLGRKVPTGAVDKNLIHDNGEKPHISPTIVKEEIKPTKLPDLSAASPTVLVGTYIDNLFAEIKPADNNTPSPDTDKKILFSQVAVISGDSVIITDDNKTLSTDSTTKVPETNGTTTPETSIISPTPEVIESSVAEPDTTTEAHESEEVEEEDDGSSRKKSRLTFTTKKPSFTPVIIPFASRNRPTFSPKARVPSLGSATTITRADFTPTITATPTLKSVRPSGFGGNRKASSFGGSSSAGKRFTGRSSISNPSANVPSASRSGGFGGRASIQPTSRRTGFRSSSIRANSLDFASRSAIPRIRPTASSRLRGNRNSASISLPPPEQNESETSGTQQEETATEALNEVTEAPIRTTSNPLLRFRRPLVARQPGTAVTPRVTTPSTRRTAVTSRGRLTTTTRKPTTRSTTNPLLSLRRQRPQNSLFPRRNLFKQPEPEPEEEIKENEQEVEESEELLEGEEFEEDNDYESSNRKEQQVATPSTPAPKRNVVSIRPFSRRRVKRQVDYGNRKYTNFRRPGLKSAATKAPEPEPETEPPAPVTQKARPGNRFNSRLSSGSRTTTSAPQKSSQRQPFIVRGESRTTTTSAPAYRRSSKSRSSSRTTTLSSRPKAPKLLNSRSQSERSRSPSRSSTSRSRTRTTTNRASSRQRNSFENFSGERQNYKSIVDNGKITITHQIPTEVTIPVVNGKITEYKNVLTAKPSIEVLLKNQVATTLGPLGNQQLVLASESTKLAENGATELIKFYLHETPTTTVIFTPTTIRGRKTSYSHVLPSTVYNVEPVTQTIAPEINANVPLANLLLSQLLLGNQQPGINPLLALQGQGLLPQQPVVQTPVTEYKTRTTTYVTTVTDARETVLPITFKGKAILTTIVDPTTNVITATEYVTDTIVSTPTALVPPPQFNSLLLPLLLQQQQQQQQAIANPLLQTPNPLLGLGQPDLNLLQNNNLNNDIYSNSPKPNILQDLNSNEDFDDEVQDIEEDAPPPPPPARARNKPRAPKPAPPKLTSVVTMYVSGRYPGEFSTVLSTVVVDDTQTVRKREAVYYEDIEVLPSILPTVGQLVSSQSDSALENSIVSGTEKYLDDSTFKSQIATQSLESIVGSLSEHIRYDASPTYVVKLATATAIRDLNLSSVDDVS